MAEPSDHPEADKKPPKKADNTTIAQRIEEVLRIRLDGAQFHDIVQYAAEKAWGINERQIRNYIARADELLVERLDKKRKPVIARHVAQRQSLFARAVNNADLRTALAILDSECKLRGLFPETGVKELLKLVVAQGEQIKKLEAETNAIDGRETPTTGSASGGTPRTTPDPSPKP